MRKCSTPYGIKGWDREGDVDDASVEGEVLNALRHQRLGQQITTVTTTFNTVSVAHFTATSPAKATGTANSLKNHRLAGGPSSKPVTPSTFYPIASTPDRSQNPQKHTGWKFPARNAGTATSQSEVVASDNPVRLLGHRPYPRTAVSVQPFHALVRQLHLASSRVRSAERNAPYRL
ncbi:MAG: hypothetical protein KME26_10115 [Oscillatoria princeps RMCB-10]|nr:hypothetical protein [Oscillatoria princeps RMCB-10]